MKEITIKDVAGFHIGGGWEHGIPPHQEFIIVYNHFSGITINTLQTYLSIYSLNTFKISSKSTLFISGPSITICISLLG